MTTINKTRTFLTASELVKVKDVSLDENEALRIYRDAFVEQCENGFTFAQLKDNHRGDEFGNISAVQYMIAISKLLSLACVKFETSVRFGSATHDHTCVCVTHLVVTEEMGYNTYKECKKFYARHAKMLQNRTKKNCNENMRKYLQVFETINAEKPTRLAEQKKHEADKEFCELPDGRNHLTLDELYKVAEMNVDDYPVLKEYKDIFICQCAIGFRTIDVVPADEIACYYIAVANLLRRAGIVENPKKNLRIHPNLGRRTFAVFSHSRSVSGNA